MKRYIKTIILFACFLLLAVFSLFLSPVSTYFTGSFGLSAVREIPYNEFIKQVESGKVSSVEYSKTNASIYGVTVDGTRFKTDNPQTDDFKKYLLEHNVKVNAAKTDFVGMLEKVFLQLLTTGLTIYIILVLFSKVVMQNQTAIGRGRFEVVEKCDVTFDDVAGNEEAKEDMLELVDFLRNPEKYRKYGAKIPKGTILYGPPGTGKTLMAKALAGTAKVPFIAVSGSEFVEKFVGVGAARVRQLFETARKKAPCIVFIDEIDAVGRKRGNSNGGIEERDQTLNQILVEMDGFTGNEGVVVIAATNRIDILDEALLRAGRFDRQIKIDLPDMEARYEILKLHAKNKPLAPDVDLREVARITAFMSGADLANIMNEASIYAARFGHKKILMSDIDRAITKVIAGDERKNRKNITKKDKEIAAFHEAGHVVAAKLLTRKSVPKATIIPTTKGAGGYTLIAPDAERMFETKQDLLNEIAVNLGGRAAEELVFGEENITGGACQDLKVATEIAVRMVKHYGMNKNIGLVNVEALHENSLISSSNEDVVREVKAIIEDAYKKVKDLLSENKNTLFNLAKALLDKETLYEKEINAIIKNGCVETTSTKAQQKKPSIISGLAELLGEEELV